MVERLLPQSAWVSRYFVWHEKGLTYWKSEKHYLSDKTPLGFLANEDGLVTKPWERDDENKNCSNMNTSDLRSKSGYTFRFQSNSREIVVKASSQKSRENWFLASNLNRSADQNKDSREDFKLTVADLLDDSGKYDAEFLDCLTEKHLLTPWEYMDEASVTRSVTQSISAGQPTMLDVDDEDSLPAGKDKMTIHELLNFAISSVNRNFRITWLFLLTFICYMQPAELLEQLTTIYRTPPNEYQDIAACCTTRANVLKVISRWIALFFKDVEQLKEDISAFATLPRLQAGGSFVGEFAATVLQLEDDRANLVQEFVEEGENKDALSAKAQHKSTSNNFLKKFVGGSRVIYEFKASAVAQELTRIDFENFQLIKPRELVRKEWKRASASVNAPNIVRMIEVFNQRSFWVASEILQVTSAQERVKAIKHFVCVLDEVFALNNFYSAYAILNGLTLTPVFRLKSAWNPLPSKTKQQFVKLRVQLDNSKNWKAYRERFSQLRPATPKIPHLAVILKDLFGFEELPSVDGQVVNWGKFKQQYRTMGHILTSQRHPYWSDGWERNPELELAIHAGTVNCSSEETLWKRSYQFDPKGSGGQQTEITRKNTIMGFFGGKPRKKQ